MLILPQKGNWRYENNLGSVSSETWGVNVTSGAASNVKGTAVELITSSAFDTYMVVVQASNYAVGALATDGCLDILVGAAGVERVLIPDLLMGYCNRVAAQGRGPRQWMFPLYIPAGTRISAKSAGLRLSTGVQVAIYLYGGRGYPAFKVGTKVTTYGITTVPNGTSFTPGASGLQGSYAEIVLATTDNHFAFLPSVQVTNDSIMNPRAIRVGLGIGAATEVEIGSWSFWTDSGETMDGPHPNFPAFHDVPLGTRLTVRGSASNTLDAGYDAVIHALT